MKPFGFIYKLTNSINHKVYIGSTRQSLYERLKSHLADSYANATKINKAILEIGKTNFSICLIKTCYCEEQLRYSEEFFIKNHRTTEYEFGYNSYKSGGVGRINS